MRHCPADLPWHRVVNASGGISLRANVGSMLTQRLLLEQEGVRGAPRPHPARRVPLDGTADVAAAQAARRSSRL